MNEILLCICDTDDAYLVRMNSYILHREKSPFTVKTYSQLSNIEIQGDGKGILLINSEFFTDLDIREDFYIGEWKQIFILNEGALNQICFEKLKLRLTMPINIIDKYQSARSIYEYLIENCIDIQSMLRADIFAGKKGRSLVYGIYAPGEGQLQGEYALNLARSFSEKENCLYVSFEEFADISSESGSLSDLALMIKEKSRDLLLKMENYMIKEGKLDILPPAACPYDLREIREDEWYCFIEQLSLYGRYTKIVINFGTAVPYISLMEACCKIYIPCRSQCEHKCRGFIKLLTFMGKEDISKKAEIKILGG